MSYKQEPVVRSNATLSPLRDLYHWLIQLSWPRFLGIYVVFFLGMNLVFGEIYLRVGGLVNAGNSFWDAFFFSVHTLATVGYGNIYPHSMVANSVAAIEIMIGMFTLALMTGLIFAKFSRPTARVLFSRHAVVHPRNGVPCLVFRLSNARGHHVAEASLTVVVLKNDETLEGDKSRKIHNLTLERSQTPFFILSWMVYHPITPDSPLYGLSHEDMLSGDMRVLLSLTGYDPILGQTMYARHTYMPEDIRFGFRLKDALRTVDRTRLHLDFEAFHEIEPLK